MGVLDLPGPDFLGLYAALLAVAAPVALLLRRVLRRPGGNVDLRFLSLRPVEIAYLAGGEQQAVTALVASLAQQKLITVNKGTEPTLTVAGPLPRGADAVEQELYGLLGTGSTTLERTSKAATRVLAPLHRKLMALGLLIPERNKWPPRVVPALVLGAMLLLGLAKVAVGVSRDTPIGFLIALCALVAGAIAWLLGTGPRRSLLGDRVLDQLRLSNSGLRTTASAKPDRLSSDDLALAVGLFGVSAIASGPMGDLGEAMKHRRQRSDGNCSSCSSGCGGGSGGGGCGGGCGGCGG